MKCNWTEKRTVTKMETTCWSNKQTNKLTIFAVLKNGTNMSLSTAATFASNSSPTRPKQNADSSQSTHRVSFTSFNFLIFLEFSRITSKIMEISRKC